MPSDLLFDPLPEIFFIIIVYPVALVVCAGYHVGYEEGDYLEDVAYNVFYGTLDAFVQFLFP